MIGILLPDCLSIEDDFKLTNPQRYNYELCQN